MEVSPLQLIAMIFWIINIIHVLLPVVSHASSSSTSTSTRDPRDRPNFVVFLADDMGYGDLASYGHPTQERGPIDDIMVEGGIRFTQGYVPDSVCSPSRAALLTGRYPARMGIYPKNKPLWRVFLPWTKTGLPQSELTLAEALKEVGYSTGMVGKWHLGINSNTRDDWRHLPFNQGFDFVGHFLPFTNDLDCDTTGRFFDVPNVEKSILMKGDTIVAQPYNQTYITQTFLNDAMTFIDENAADPFFFYFSFSHPHTSLFTSPQFAGRSRRGEYGDNVNEMNWAVGEVLRTLEDNGIAENTLVLFMSDHGPHVEMCGHGGDPGPFKGYKTNSWEGGVRVPFVAYWPETITPRHSHAVVSTLDIIQTFVDLAGGSLPDDRPYDGQIITDVLLGSETSPHDVLYFYCSDRLTAVRSGPYKVHFYTHRVRERDYFAENFCDDHGRPIEFHVDCQPCYDECVVQQDPPLIYNVEVDPVESVALDASNDAALNAFMVDLLRKVEAHRANFVAERPLLDEVDDSHSIVPCCDPDNGCSCNFGPVDGPYNNYEPKARKSVQAGVDRTETNRKEL